VFCKDARQKIGHPFFDRIGVAVNEGADTQYGSVSFSNFLVIIRGLSVRNATGFGQAEKSILFTGSV
jgi:hypothetical protein